MKTENKTTPAKFKIRITCGSIMQDKEVTPSQYEKEISDFRELQKKDKTLKYKIEILKPETIIDKGIKAVKKLGEKFKTKVETPKVKPEFSIKILVETKDGMSSCKEFTNVQNAIDLLVKVRKTLEGNKHKSLKGKATPTLNVVKK